MVVAPAAPSLFVFFAADSLPPFPIAHSSLAAKRRCGLLFDVFVVGFLAALIQMGNLMSVHPGPAAVAFAGTVIFTMLAANSMDPRIFWDEEREGHV